MLQIISGKFFTGEGKVNEKPSDAILYSNYAWLAPVSTPVAELRPVDTHRGPFSSYVLRYTNRYEQSPRDVLVLPTADEAVDQFRLLSSLWFRSLFHVDRQHVELLCRSAPKHALDSVIPCRLVPRFFDSPVFGSATEVDEFCLFMKKVLGMPRTEYNRLMSCLGVFFNALEAINTNLDLAYSMFVYVLEALSQGADRYVPVWRDYDESTRSRLDAELSLLEGPVAERIRGILLGNAHLKLMKRFISFVSEHVVDSFFLQEAAERPGALSKSDLGRTLRNLYSTRSGFVHELRLVHEQIRMPLPGWDVMVWDNEPYFTLAGLVRLCRHVLLTFIHRQPAIEREEYPTWRNELPGTIEGRWHPRYWVGQASNFGPQNAKFCLSGFTVLVLEAIQNPKNVLPDLRLLMEKIEEVLPQAKKADRSSLLAIYELWHAFIFEKGKRPNWKEVLGRYEEELLCCSAARLVIHVLLGAKPPWTPSECETAFLEYQRTKYKATALNFPRLLELATEVEIANIFLREGQAEQFDLRITTAILDAAGRPVIQQHLEDCKASRKVANPRLILGCALSNDPTTSTSSKATVPPESEGKLDEACSVSSEVEQTTLEAAEDPPR